MVFFKMNLYLAFFSLTLMQGKLKGNAMQKNTEPHKEEDPLSIPLIDVGGAPLVAMLYTSSMNVRIKSFIKTLMATMLDDSQRKQIHNTVMETLTKDSTTDLIRNITIQELDKELVSDVKTSIPFREQMENIVKETLKQNSSIDLIRNIAVQEIMIRNQSGEEIIGDSNQDVQIEKISRPFGVTETIGKTFYLGFLESHGKNGDLYLYLLSSSDGSCQLFIPSTGINTTFSVVSTRVNSYKISPDVCLDQHGIQRKTVFIKCDIPVSAYGLTFLSDEVDGFLALPYEVLGQDYIVSSFTLKTKRETPNTNSNFGIIAISKSTNIMITFRMSGGMINYKASRYRNDDTLHIHLVQFDTFYLSHDYDLSGTLITATSPVAVMSGVRTSYLRNGYGNHMEEMILPKEQLGRDFIVPNLYDSQCNFRIFAQTQTRVRTYDNSLVEYINIQRGSFKEYVNYNLYTLQSSAPVQVQLYCNGASSSYDAFMATLPSIQHFKSSYKFPIVNDFKYPRRPHFYTTIIIQSFAKAGLRLDSKEISNYKGTSTVTLESTLYSVITVELSVGLHEIQQNNDIPFGLIVHGRTKYSGYGFPAGFAIKIKP